MYTFMRDIGILTNVHVSIGILIGYQWLAWTYRSCWILCRVHWENSHSISFQIEWETIVVTVFLLILNQMKFHLVSVSDLNQMEFNLVQNRKENCHHEHIPFNLKGNRNVVFSVYNDRPYSYPRDWRFSAIVYAQSTTPESPRASQQGFEGGPQLIPHYAERCQFLGQPM